MSEPLRAGSSQPPRPDGMRVLFVTSSFPRWPGDSSAPFILNLAQDLRALGWDVQVLAPHAPGARRRERYEELMVERFRYCWPERAQTVCYGGGALANLRDNPLNLAKLPLLVLSELGAVLRRARAFDLVHSHWILPQGFTAALAARPLGVPHVATIHGSDIFALTGRLATACKQLVLKSADAVTVNSSATERAALSIQPRIRHLERIPMGASDHAENPAAVRELRERYARGAGPLLLFVGRLIEEKGAADLLSAVALIQRELPDVTALLVGDGPQRPALEQLAASLNVADRVAFTGWIRPEEIGSYYRAAHVFVGPSKRARHGGMEAQGLTFAEALLAGTPVIATPSGGIGDAIRHEETGLVVPENAPEAIAAAVLRLAGDPQLASRLRDNGQALARRQFAREASARAFARLYERVLTERSQAGARPSVRSKK